MGNVRKQKLVRKDVTRDSKGDINGFFGHVCGGIVLHGDSLAEVYEYLSEYYDKATLSLPFGSPDYGIRGQAG